MPEQTAIIHYRRGEMKSLPDLPQWVNRFEVKSQTSNQIYIVSQNKARRHWGCSCPGYKAHRNCKHLKSIGLPCFEKPFEVTLKEVT